MSPNCAAAAVAAAQAPYGDDSPPLAAIRTTLANGLRVVLCENHAVPLVWLNWVCLGGYEWDPPLQAGLAALTPALLKQGTAHRTAGQIVEEVDDLGADLTAGADWDAAFLNLELLSWDLASGAELLIDMACHPRFAEGTVAGMRQRQLAELDRRRRDPRAIADDEFARAVHGSTVYGRSPLGTRETLERLTAADLASFHHARYAPGNSYLVLVGSFDSDEAMDRLGSFELPPVQLADTPWAWAASPGVGPGAEVRLVAVPQALHTELRVGHASVARDSENLPALEVVNALLGRGPCSRLAASLRQRDGLTYHIASRFVARHRGGHFVVETSVANGAAPAAVATIRREIERLHDELAPAAEVEQAKCSLLGAELQRFQSIFGTGVTIGPMALEGDPAQQVDRRRRAIAAVEPDMVRELARRHLRPERLVTVAVGTGEALTSQFRGDGAYARPLPVESIS